MTITDEDRKMMKGIDLGKPCPMCDLNVVREAQLRAYIETLEIQIPNLKWHMGNIAGKLHEMRRVAESYQTKYRLACFALALVFGWALWRSGAVKP